MSNEKFSQLPTVINSTLGDIIAAVQGGISTQQTLGQVIALGLANTVLHFAGNPNGNVAGSTYQLCWDSTDLVMYVCTTSGNSATAVWTVSGSIAFPLAVLLGGTGLSSTTINQLLYSVSNNVIAGLATNPSAILRTDAGGVPALSASLTNGQIMIGSTGAAPAPSTISAGSGISIANTAGHITISGTGGGYSWTEVTGTTQAISVNNGYIANNSGLVTLTLPATANVGDTFSVQGKGAGLYSIAQNASQIIHFGSSPTTVGAGGSLTATNQFDSIEIICITANTTWAVLTGAQGNFTVV